MAASRAGRSPNHSAAPVADDSTQIVAAGRKEDHSFGARLPGTGEAAEDAPRSGCLRARGAASRGRSGRLGPASRHLGDAPESARQGRPGRPPSSFTRTVKIHKHTRKSLELKHTADGPPWEEVPPPLHAHHHPQRKHDTSRGPGRHRHRHRRRLLPPGPPRGGRGRRLGPGVGGGRARPSQSCETPGASGHVSDCLPCSKLQLAPRPARRDGRACPSPGGGGERSALPPQLPNIRHGRAACEHCRRAWPARSPSRPISAAWMDLGDGVRGPSPRSPRPDPGRSDSRLRIPSTHPPHLSRPKTPAQRVPAPSVGLTLRFGYPPRPPTSAKRARAPGAVSARPRVCAAAASDPSFLQPHPAPAARRPKGPGASPPGWRPSPRAPCLHAPTHIRNLAGPQST